MLITGASSGLGEALAHTFHAAGCKVILASRNEVSLQRVKNELAAKQTSVSIGTINHLDPDMLVLSNVPVSEGKYISCGSAARRFDQFTVFGKLRNGSSFHLWPHRRINQ